MKDKKQNTEDDFVADIVFKAGIAIFILTLLTFFIPLIITFPLCYLMFGLLFEVNEKDLQGPNYKQNKIWLVIQSIFPFILISLLFGNKIISTFMKIFYYFSGRGYMYNMANSISKFQIGSTDNLFVLLWFLIPAAYKIWTIFKDNSYLQTNKNGKILNKGAIRNLDKVSGLDLNDERVQFCFRNKHHLVLGASGSGKTFSVLEPIIETAIDRKESIFVIDPKGDKEFRDAVYSYCVNFDLKDKFKYLSLSNPKISIKFNPLKDLSDEAIKDVLISMSNYSEPYYKKRCEIELVKAIEKFRNTNPCKVLTISEINKYLVKTDDTKGLKADLELLCYSSFGELINDESAKSLKDFYLDSSCFFFSIDVQMYPEASVQFGRMILAILKAISNDVQTNYATTERRKCSIVIDEFGSFISPNFIDFLNKARSASMRIVMATQSLGDIDRFGSSMRKQLIDSTAVKVIMQLSDPDSREWAANLIGTKQSQKKTFRMQDGFFAHKTGDASVRDVEEYVVHPNVIKQLNTGTGIVTTSTPYSANFYAFTDDHKNRRSTHRFEPVIEKIPLRPAIELKRDEGAFF